MTYYVSKKPKVDPLALSVLFMAEAAIASAYAIILVKKPVRFLLDSVLTGISGLLRYMADKSARGAYHVLSSIVNNGLTRRITPSVSTLDDKIENACSTVGRWVGSAIVFPFTLAFYLLATAYSTAISLTAALTYCVFTTLRFVLCLPVKEAKLAYEMAFLATKKDAEGCKNTASKALYWTYTLAYRFLFWAIVHPVLELCAYMLCRAVFLVLMCFYVPAHMLSSVLRLNNRFDIYNYESGMGTIHNYIQDLLASHHGGGHLIPTYMKEALVNEATKGDLAIIETIYTDKTLTKLDGAKLEQYTQQQQMASA